MRQQKYFKRHRMELDLRHARPAPELPPGFHWRAWAGDLLESHARVKFACFAGEPDAEVFPCLGSLAGCRDLMVAIATRHNFSPRATWLVAGPEGDVGTVQGLCDGAGVGGIQNLGVVPRCRGLGIGLALLLKALEGFQAVGLTRAFLEVTASNHAAVRMYRRLGFRAHKTIYRGVDVAAPDPAGVGI